MKVGYLVRSRNGQGKNHFFIKLQDALNYAEKYHPNWVIYKVLDKSIEGLEVYETIQAIKI